VKDVTHKLNRKCHADTEKMLHKESGALQQCLSIEQKLLVEIGYGSVLENWGWLISRQSSLLSSRKILSKFVSRSHIPYECMIGIAFSHPIDDNCIRS